MNKSLGPRRSFLQTVTTGIAVVSSATQSTSTRPIAENLTVYFSAGWGDGSLYAVDTETGRQGGSLPNQQVGPHPRRALRRCLIPNMSDMDEQAIAVNGADMNRVVV